MARRKKKKRNTIHITALNKPTLIIMVGVSMAAGIISGLACVYSFIFLPAVILFFWFTWVCMMEFVSRK